MKVFVAYVGLLPAYRLNFRVPSEGVQPYPGDATLTRDIERGSQIVIADISSFQLEDLIGQLHRMGAIEANSKRRAQLIYSIGLPVNAEQLRQFTARWRGLQAA